MRHGGVYVALAVLQREAPVAGEELRELQLSNALYGGDGLFKRTIPDVLEHDTSAKEEGIAAEERALRAVVNRDFAIRGMPGGRGYDRPLSKLSQ